jgi:hypothetical protein
MNGLRNIALLVRKTYGIIDPNEIEQHGGA